MSDHHVDVRQRPSTTCGFREKTARKTHTCYDCCTPIKAGTTYVQDDYYAPFGNGRRYCHSCAAGQVKAEIDWADAWNAEHPL